MIKQPEWKQSHVVDGWYFLGPMNRLFECWRISDDDWYANGYGINESATSWADAKGKCEAAYYRWMSEFVDPLLKAYVVVRYRLEDEISADPIEGAYSTLELARDAVRRSTAWVCQILEVEVDDMSGPCWAPHPVQGDTNAVQ